ncbi:MAG: hypothetical protein HXL63_00460 [Thermobifida sp.]|nr:hypothetical protein [Thermobifida sp.]
MNKPTTRRRYLRPWRTLIAGASLTAALTLGFAMRGLDNPNGLPEWTFWPALGLLALAVVLIRADWKAGRL